MLRTIFKTFAICETRLAIHSTKKCWNFKKCQMCPNIFNIFKNQMLAPKMNLCQNLSFFFLFFFFSFSLFFSRGRFENKLRKNQTWSDVWLWTFFRKRTLLGNEILLYVFIFVLFSISIFKIEKKDRTYFQKNYT